MLSSSLISLIVDNQWHIFSFVTFVTRCCYLYYLFFLCLETIELINMKTRELLLLCLFSFISMSVNAGQYQKNERKIRLEKHDSKNSPEKAGRSTIPFEVFAYLNSDYELISVDLKSTADVEVSVTSLFTNETILSDSYSTSTSEIILNLAGLLNEGEAYRIEITIGDTVLYGDFTY